MHIDSLYMQTPLSLFNIYLGAQESGLFSTLLPRPRPGPVPVLRSRTSNQIRSQPHYLCMYPSYVIKDTLECIEGRQTMH